MNRNLLIGIVISLALHSVGAWWALGLTARPLAVVHKDPQLVRTVRERVELPKPKPAEPKPPEIKKVDEAAKPADAPQPKLAASKPMARSKSDKAPKTSAPTNEPAPLVLSKTYGADDGEGLAVQAGQEDVLGDPAVQATDDNVRRRPPPDSAAPTAGSNGSDNADQVPGKIVILQAKPKDSCDRFVQWPADAARSSRSIEVTLLLEIGEDGTLRRVKILRGAGEPFDSQAIADIKQCPFSAGRRDGKPIASKVAFVVEFKPR
ncbi:MAG: TonB family protein [Myxococcales bacterium]|nr:TonB family protein [Myxococcales bacterium]